MSFEQSTQALVALTISLWLATLFALGFRDLTIDQLHPQISTSLLYQTFSTDKGFISVTPPAIKSAQTIPWILGTFESIYSHLILFLGT